MDFDDIYCDVDSTKSLSQLMGRPSLRLASLPSTPPPPSPLRSRDTNTAGNSKHQQHRGQHHQRSLRGRRGVVRGVRTAPTSPVQSRREAGPPRTPLTPTVSTARLPRRSDVTEFRNDDDADNILPLPLTRGAAAAAAAAAGDVGRARVDNGDAEDEETSLAQSGRWVTFSFTSTFTSRRQSESRPSSPSPRPRAAIIPSKFPSLHFLDEDFPEPECVDSATPTPTASPRLSFERPLTCAHESPEEVQEEEEEVTANGRESLLLTSISASATIVDPAPNCGFATTATTTTEVERPLIRHSIGKRERSVPPSPSVTSFIICDRGGGSTCLGSSFVVDATTNQEDDITENAKRARTNDHPPKFKNLIESTGCDEKAEYSMEIAAPTASMLQSSMHVEHGGDSLVLVDGPTPTPWRNRFPATAANERENELHPSSIVIDARCSGGTAAVVPRTLFDNISTRIDACEDYAKAHNNEKLNISASCNLVDLPQHQPEEDMTSKVEQDKTAGDTSLTIGEASSRRPSEDLMVMIESAREEVRRASERLLAAIEANRCVAFERSPGRPHNDDENEKKDSVATDCTWIDEASLQLTFGRSSTASGVDVTRNSPWITERKVPLRRELAIHAGSILRRLRGYDHADAGFLPMRVVARVVQLVLSKDAAAAVDTTPMRCSGGGGGGGSANRSSLVSPSPFSAGCSEATERIMARQKTRADEESAMELCVNLFRCFRECFGDRNAARRFGIIDATDVDRTDGEESSTSNGKKHSHPLATCFPRVRQQLSLLGQSSSSSSLLPSPQLLATNIDYNVFAASLTELN